jgi:hypothetical protein
MAANDTTRVTATISNMSPGEKLDLILTVTNLRPDESLESRLVGTLRGIALATPAREKQALKTLILSKAREDIRAALELVEMKFTGGRSKSKRRKQTKRR